MNTILTIQFRKNVLDVLYEQLLKKKKTNQIISFRMNVLYSQKSNNTISKKRIVQIQFDEIT